MAQVSAAMKERLLQQRKAMQSGGMLINNKGLKRMRLRVLPPRDGELPGVEYTSFYSKSLGEGTTSPISFGVACPVNDALDSIYREGDKDAKDFAKDFCRRQKEYWIPVIDREDEGTVDNPNVRILRGKQTIYQQITDWMTDEDDGEDVTHVTEGRDLIIKRKGTGLETEWTADKCDRSPISEDETMAETWTELAGRFDVRTRFFAVKLETLEKIYTGLTGQPIPEHYLEAINAIGSGVPEDDAGDEGAGEETATETEEVVETSEVDLTGQTVSFTDDEGNEVVGVVSGPDDETEGNYNIPVEGGSPGEVWSIAVGELTVFEETSEEAEAPEEAPAPSPSKRVVKVAAKPDPKPASKPVAKAPPAKTMTKPAAKPPVNPAVTKTATMPRKPGAPGTAKPASSAIKNRLLGKAAKK